MSNKTEFLIRFIKEYSQRDFDPNDTMKWLTHDAVITMSWGFKSPTTLGNSGFMFKVNGFLHKGWVLITLAGNDTYTLRFFSNSFKEVKNKVTNVYCDELQERVDNEVERIGN